MEHMEAATTRAQLVAAADKARDRALVAERMHLDAELVRVRKINATIAAARVRTFDLLGSK